MDDSLLTETRSNAQLRCGDCQFFKGAAHASYGEPCSKLGVSSSKIAPNCWSPNLTVLRPIGRDTLQTLAGIVTSMSPQQSRIFMGLLRGAGSLDRIKLTFLQEVYFSLGQPDSLDVIYRGYVVARGPGDTVLLLASPSIGDRKCLTSAHVSRSSLMTRAKFVKMRAELSAQGRIYHVPKKPRHSIANADAYEPPTFDTSPEELEARAKKAMKKPRKQRAIEIQPEAKARKRPAGQMFSVDTSEVEFENDGL